MSEIDRLYRLPLAEFTAERNGLAKRLREEGEREAAEDVRRLAKPSVAAWLVNRLYHQNRKAFDALLQAAGEQRDALERRGTISAEAADRQRKAMRRLTEAAREHAAHAGSAWTPALRQRVTRTLEALAAAPPGDGPTPGRLTVDLEPPGFDVLLGTAIRKPKRPAKAAERSGTRGRARSAAAERRIATARGSVDEARKDVTAARRKRTGARKTLERSEARAGRAEKSARVAEEKAETARARAHAADLERRKARSAVDDAERAVARAESRLAEATRRLEALR